MFKPLLTAVIAGLIQAYLLIQLIAGGWLLPAQICPPTNWPLTEKSRNEYRPFDNWNETVNMLIP